jgi:rod shape-determining protein MreD
MLMNSLVYLLCVYAVAVLDSQLSSAWEIAGVRPDLFALAAFVWLMSPSHNHGLFSIAVVGLMSDLSRSTPIGIGIASFAVAAFGLSELQRRVRLDVIPLRASAIGFAAGSIALMQSVVLRLMNEIPNSWTQLVVQSSLTGIYTAAVGVPLLMILSWRTKPEMLAAATRSGAEHAFITNSLE